MIDCTDATGQGDKETAERVSDPDAEPGLPPGDTGDDCG